MLDTLQHQYSLPKTSERLTRVDELFLISQVFQSLQCIVVLPFPELLFENGYRHLSTSTVALHYLVHTFLPDDVDDPNALYPELYLKLRN